MFRLVGAPKRRSRPGWTRTRWRSSSACRSTNACHSKSSIAEAFNLLFEKHGVAADCDLRRNERPNMGKNMGRP